MYLSRIQLDLSHKGVRRALQNCNELHRDLMSAFPQHQTDAARKSENVLFRLIERKNGILLLMSSESRPDMDALRRRGYSLLPGDIKDITALKDVFQNGMFLRFELLVSPCKKVCSGEKNSRRVFLRTPDKREEWLRRQGEKYGFSICNLEEDGRQTSLDGRKGECPIHYDTVNMTGVLKIEDAQAFWTAYRQGIGPGKAYGAGMLMIAAIR